MRIEGQVVGNSNKFKQKKRGSWMMEKMEMNSSPAESEEEDEIDESWLV